MKHKLTAQELCNFCQQLGVLIHSGMGPLESLHILLEESTTDTDREVLSNLLSSMEKTGSLSQAVTDSGFFSDSMAAYIKPASKPGVLTKFWTVFLNITNRNRKHPNRSEVQSPTHFLCLV